MKVRDLNSNRPTPPPTGSPTSSLKQALKETAAKGREAARGPVVEYMMCTCEYNAHRDKRPGKGGGGGAEKLQHFLQKFGKRYSPIPVPLCPPSLTHGQCAHMARRLN